MTPADLNAIRERAEKATPGPWRACGEARNGCVCGLVWTVKLDTVAAHVETDADGGTGLIDCAGRWEGRKDVPPTDFRADAIFVAHAREDVPALLAEVERLRTALLGAKVDATPYAGPFDGADPEAVIAHNAKIDALLR